MKPIRIFKIISMIGTLSLTNVVFANVDSIHSQVMTQAKQTTLTPQQVLAHLEEGNQRFVTAKMRHRDLLMKANATSSNQYPIAVVLNCMDSRTSPELIFDQGLGDIFAIRIAGNIQNDDILGSMEFGTQIVGAKLIVVLGHTNCGAVKGACKGEKLGNLTALLQKIQPAVAKAARKEGTHDCANPSLIDAIAKENVLLVMQQIQLHSLIISNLIKQGKVEIVGGIQDLATGKVTFFNEEGKQIS